MAMSSRSARSWSKSSTSVIADVRHMENFATESDIMGIEVMSTGIIVEVVSKKALKFFSFNYVINHRYCTYISMEVQIVQLS